MQKFAGFITMIAAGYGFVVGGFLGALTGFVVTVAVASGLVIARGGSDSTVEVENQKMRRAQRLGGVTVALCASAGAYIGGWRFGWAGALVGSAMGLVAMLMFALLSGVFRVRRNDPGPGSEIQ